MFSNAALSRSQFCFDPLQIYRQETLLSSNVCYWKSAKSVNNFRSKKRPAFEKNRLFGLQAGVGGPWFESWRGHNLQLDFRCCVFKRFLLYEKSIWLNVLLTPWCSFLLLFTARWWQKWGLFTWIPTDSCNRFAKKKEETRGTCKIPYTSL